VIPVAAAALLAALSAAPPAPPTAEEARAFVSRVNAELKQLAVKASTADWIRQTYITDDTDRASAWASEDMMAYLSRTVKESLRFKDVAADPDTRRMLTLLRLGTEPPPAPSHPARRAELATLYSRLGSLYGKGKWCGKDGKQRCRDLQELSDVLAKSRSDADLLDAWSGWHSVATPMRPLYERFVELSNEGAREIGFADTGALWRSAYDMPPEAFVAETDRLWGQLRPLYEALHCYVRSRLAKVYGAGLVPATGPIPAHLLGNMWAQEWGNVYPLVEPYQGQPSLDVEAAMKAQGWDSLKMVKTGEAFFSSVGFAPLPPSFWERSMFAKPKDRDVVCHASAWDVTFSGDLRIKMCIKANEEDLVTIHHELGHNYYQRAYLAQPYLFQNSANDGFHEALGDAIALSVTPGYLQTLGLVSQVAKDEKGLVNVQMKDALDKVAFLPFGLLMDRWRWDVFSGKVKPDRYNAAWWELRRKIQGVAPPAPRTEADFDPGAKYHIAANVPYTRYFLARILQFQFHRAMCRIAGWKGPLHECSIHGNKEAGRRLEAMMAMGQSRPWPDALEALTGERRMDASALVEYFAPLEAWLDKENAGRKCGW
jgi:peptidyl-dipeptidase A